MTVKRLEKVLTKILIKNQKNMKNIQKTINVLLKDYVRYSNKGQRKEVSDVQIDISQLKELRKCIEKIDSLINVFFKE